jgi:hypothetical protein
VAAKALNPRIRHRVEPELGNDYWLSMKAGERIAPPETIADGLRTTKPGAHNFPINRAGGRGAGERGGDQRGGLVSDELTKMVVELSGAAAARLNGRPGLRRSVGW